MRMWLCVILAAFTGASAVLSAETAAAPAATPPPAPPAAGAVPDPFEKTYKGYNPGFGFPRDVSEEMKKLSSETTFFTLNLLLESSRANALVDAARQKEAEGRHREALDIYQKVIDEYPDMLYRVSEHGVFVPITEYCQLRMLAFPPDDLAFYRVKHNSRASEAFELARQKNSLEGLAEIRDKMLCTSFGAPAMTTLGFSALDRGHYLEALEYFQAVWNHFPEQRTQSPALAMSIALCRRMLGLDEGGVSERYGLIGHWKLDEASGNRAADSAGKSIHGLVAPVPQWGPGKMGGALRVDGTNGVAVPRSRFLDIGQGGSDFSVLLWVNWETGSYPNGLFTKRAHGADQMFNLEVTRDTHVRYTVATQNPKWETGETKAGVGRKKWSHVAFVKAGMEAKLFVDGKIEVKNRLLGAVLRNTAAVSFGNSMSGWVDDVRLYNRALLDREVAEAAGQAGLAAFTATPAAGETPLAVAFSYTGPGDCIWEFGDGATAAGSKVRHTYALGGDHTAVLSVTDPSGKVSVGRTRISARWSERDRAVGTRMSHLLEAARFERPLTPVQAASPSGITADDYTLMPPTRDPLGLLAPVWEMPLPGSRMDVFVYSQPVVTRNSVIYRHKNIVYCHSLLNGELRWRNNLGGRVTWQNWTDRQYPQEDVLVQDGIVFAPMFKVGPTLVALDEITGRMKWAYGPMVASTAEEANMRFETAPAGGPMTVYAGYIQDNIEGETHTDTEYGVIAFESATGRIRWRRTICRLRPGQFSAGFAMKRRNKIRSFLSPPLYFQGTVYYCTNAGAIAALDALSGQVRWVMRYPYYDAVHDSTLPFGSGGGFVQHTRMLVYPHSPMFWYNQRPLLAQDDLYLMPVDCGNLFKIDRRTGRILWSKPRGEGINANRTDGGAAYFLGFVPGGELAISYSFRNIPQNWAGPDELGGVHLIDPRTGKTVWESGDLITRATQPVMSFGYGDAANVGPISFDANRWGYVTTARPFLAEDGTLSMPGYHYSGWPIFEMASHLTHLSLTDRQPLDRRWYVGGQFMGMCYRFISTLRKTYLQNLEDLPHKTDKITADIAKLREIEKDTIPVNAHGPFMPFSRITFDRFGVPFELRMSPRSIGMVYDSGQVRQALARQTDPEGLFARGELEMGENKLAEACRLFNDSLSGISSEDQDFRSLVNQQLFKAYKGLAQSSVRSGQKATELASCVGMSQTVGTLADEIETLFALSDAYERQGDFPNAARQARSLVSVYGHYEYLTPSLLSSQADQLLKVSQAAVDQGLGLLQPSLYGQEVGRSMTLMKNSLPLYFGALSPLDKDLIVRAGELGSRRLLQYRARDAAFARSFETQAGAALTGRPTEEQLARLWEFPGTDAAQKVLDALLTSTVAELKKPGVSLADAAALRKRLWSLADTARICSLKLPEPMSALVLAPTPPPPPAPLGASRANRPSNIEEERGTAWLALERRDDLRIQPDWLFLGGRVKKKFDNKFVLTCMDLPTGKTIWKAEEQRGETWFDELRLAGKGDEPGFFEAFVFRDTVVVHGLYDVLSCNLKDGKLKWRYQVPFDFDIRETVASGDLLVLAGQAETVVLNMGTDDPRGEVVWQEKEEGDLYAPPYFHENRLVSLRKMPFNLTVRYRSTGQLMGKLSLPDLTLFGEDPLVEAAPHELPLARDGRRLVVTDGSYYLMLDVEKMKIEWKRLIDENDATQLPPMRFELKDDYLAIVKRNYDAKTIYMLDSHSGNILWQTDPKNARSPQPIYSMLMAGGRLYGIRPHPGQAFYFVGLDCKSGKDVFSPLEQKGYGGKPDVRLRRSIQGPALVAEIRDRQDFELRAFDTGSGKLLHDMKVKSAGNFGEHGRASATVQNGRLVLLGKNDLLVATDK